MKREALVQGFLLIVLLAILFPRVFFNGEYAVASSLMGAWAPWDAVFGESMQPHQNPLTIETVMVETGSSGLPRRIGLLPAASTTIMVSPTARLMARRNAPTMPGSAAGNSTRTMVSDFVAPRP